MDRRPLPLPLDPASVAAPDPDAEPAGYIVEVGSGERIHFLDWSGPMGDSPPGDRPVGDPPDGDSPVGDRPAAAPVPGPRVLLVHGLAATAWTWTPVARRLISTCRVVAMDLRGHGLSDAPTDGYDRTTLAEDVVAVAEGSGLLTAVDDRVVLAGHGFGALVATWAAGALGPRCGGLLLVDGGWEDARAATGLEPDEFLREVDEPPEVLRSMTAYLADRRGFDPASWDADQERAARSSVAELPAGRLVLAIHPHVRTACVEAMFDYRPLEALASVSAPVAALEAETGGGGSHRAALTEVEAALAARGRPIRTAAVGAVGHNLMRYRPAAVAAAILALARG